jgi:hypothetical protein
MSERRRENRAVARGSVRLSVAGQPPLRITASLLDLSANGFRAAHNQTDLSAGLEVEFSHSRAHGRARVIWTRVLGQAAESGFLILES